MLFITVSSFFWYCLTLLEESYPYSIVIIPEVIE